MASSISSSETITERKLESSILSQNFEQCSSLAVYLSEWKRIGDKHKINGRSILDQNSKNCDDMNLRASEIGDTNIAQTLKNLQNVHKWKKF